MRRSFQDVWSRRLVRIAVARGAGAATLLLLAGTPALGSLSQGVELGLDGDPAPRTSEHGLVPDEPSTPRDAAEADDRRAGRIDQPR